MDSGLGFFQPMFFVGVVEDRNDPRVEGRVRVRAFGVHGSNRDIPTEDLPWATLIIGNHDVNFTPPPLNAWVFGFFVDGRDAQQPMILGLIPTQASELVNPEKTGWGSVPSENYDRESQGSRPRDLGLSPLSRLATGEFLNETYNEALETNRVKNIPIAGGYIRNHNPIGNGNSWSNDLEENPDGGFISTRETSATELEIYRGLRSRGLSDAAAKGIIANMIVESNLNPGINEIAPLVPGSRGGFGLIQWTGPRRRKLEEEAQRRNVAVSNLDFQLDYLMVELKGPERRSYENILRTNDAEEAARIFSDQNLRPGIPNTSRRLAEARRLSAIDFNTEEISSINTAANQNISDDSNVERAEDLRIKIAEIDKDLKELGNSSEVKDERNILLERREELERKLSTLVELNPTERTISEPYSGYASAQAFRGKYTSSWDEPPSGYNAKYPFNRVIETASGHSIEFDDSPGGERIMIWHRDGSYIQITGTSTTHKNASDSYHINERNNHIFIGGNNIVTIEGDSHVLVKGNKVEEIEGNYKQIVHGNVQIGGAGRVEINGADRTDIRSAALGLHSNIENLNIRTHKNIVFESEESFSVKSKNIRIGASENMSVSGRGALFLESQSGNIHMKSDSNIFLNPSKNLFLQSKGSIAIKSEGGINLNTESYISMHSSKHMNIGADAELLIGSKEGSVNLNAKNKIGIIASDLFLEGENDLNMNSGSDFNIKTSRVNMGADSMFIESSQDVDLKGNHIKVGGGSKVSIDATVVALDDIIQLANGDATTPSGLEKEADKKEPLDPSDVGNFTDEDAIKAEKSEIPSDSTSSATGLPLPPDRSSPKPRGSS